jgi:hypothetical protein
MFSICYFKPYLLAILVLINIGFVSNKVCILDITLREQFLENLQRFAKAGNKGLFLATKLFSLILTLEPK